MDKNKISIEEFIGIACVKLQTIKNNKDKIPGLTYKDGKFAILSGTRYPRTLSHYKLNSHAKKRYVLLKEISRYNYIDHKLLGVYQEQFETFLAELMAAGLIKENGLANHYGANAYDCTTKGDEILKGSNTNKKVNEIAELVASVCGHFVGSVICEVYK